MVSNGHLQLIIWLVNNSKLWSLERPSVQEAAEAAEMQHPKKDLAGHASFCLKDYEVHTPARSRDEAPANSRRNL